MNNRDDIFYQLRIERSLIISIAAIILSFKLFPMFENMRPTPENIPIIMEIEDIPITRQGRFRPPPPRPVVPIPSEEEDIPEDETIIAMESNADYFNTFDDQMSGFAIIAAVPARLITEVIPEYPKEDYHRGITGVVKLHIHINERGDVVEVVVLENTTKSELCAEAAKVAAMKCRYQPARKGRENVSSWMSRSIRFDIKK